MSAVFRAAAGGLGGRRLQAIIIGLVVLVATAASTLALGMLADAHSPFDHAFAQQNGAHVAVTVDTSVASAAQITNADACQGRHGRRRTVRDGKRQRQGRAAGRHGGSISTQLNFAGRSSPGGPVDDLTLQQGHWAASDDQAVVSDTGNAPSQLGTTITVGSRTMTVVGVADSVTNTADVWVLPAEMAAIAGQGGSGQAQLLYRFASSATDSDISADIGEVEAALPSGAVLSHVSYLSVRQSEQSSVAPWVPFIVAFGVIALAISVLIVVNVVGGAVVAGTTRIGVLKSIGFTPAQVVACYVLLVAVPAVTGAAAGLVVRQPARRAALPAERAGVPGRRAWRAVLGGCRGAARGDRAHRARGRRPGVAGPAPCPRCRRSRPAARRGRGTGSSRSGSSPG